MRDARVKRLANRMMAMAARQPDIAHEAIGQLMTDFTYVEASGRGKSVAALYRMLADELEDQDMLIH